MCPEMKQCNLSKSQSGLTLIELLVSLTIFSIIVTITLSVFFSAQRMQRKIDNKYDCNAEADRVVKQIEQSLCFARTLVAGTESTITFIDINYDTIEYHVSEDTLLRNQKNISTLSVDSLLFVYIKVIGKEKVADFYLFDKDRNGVLEDDEFSGISGITVYVDFLYPESSGSKRLKIKKQLTISFRNFAF
jgi:prepilin-type N-terminal cleavage/methylation domain-containing protein